MSGLLSLDLNAAVFVKLTDFGAQRLDECADEFGVKLELMADGRHGLVLWELIRIFGPALFLGMPQIPFVDNII